MIECFAESHFAGIDSQRVGDGAYRLVLEFIGCQRVGVELLAVLLHPSQDHVSLGRGERRTPVGQIILHEGHGAVGYAFLDFGQVHLVHCLAFGQSLQHGGNVECLVAFFHILRDERLGYGETGVEGQVGIGGMAEGTTAVVQNLCHLLVRSQRGIGSLVHRTVCDGQTDQHHGTAQNDFA